MADTVSTRTVVDTSDFLIVHITNSSDGVGEAAVQKVDISGVTGPSGGTASAVTLLKAEWACSGMSVLLAWDHTANDNMLLCSGTGSRDLAKIGGMKDPASTGGTGDVVATTIGHTAGDTYDILLTFKKED